MRINTVFSYSTLKTVKSVSSVPNFVFIYSLVTFLYSATAIFSAR